jgi:hypothetical protein
MGNISYFNRVITGFYFYDFGNRLYGYGSPKGPLIKNFRSTRNE